MDPRTVLYKEFLAERQEILCHKWIESEKAGYDIGFEHALFDWTLKYRSAWLEKRLQQMRPFIGGAGVTRKAFAQFFSHLLQAFKMSLGLFKMFDEGIFQIRISRRLRHFWQRLD